MAEEQTKMTWKQMEKEAIAMLQTHGCVENAKTFYEHFLFKGYDVHPDSVRDFLSRKKHLFKYDSSNKVWLLIKDNEEEAMYNIDKYSGKARHKICHTLVKYQAALSIKQLQEYCGVDYHEKTIRKELNALIACGAVVRSTAQSGLYKYEISELY